MEKDVQLDIKAQMNYLVMYTMRCFVTSGQPSFEISGLFDWLYMLSSLELLAGHLI